MYGYGCCETHTHVHTQTYIHIMKYYSAMENNEIMPFAATHMRLKITTLSEVNQRNKNTILYHLCVESKKYKSIYLQNRLTNIENKHGYQRRKVGGGTNCEFWSNIYILLNIYDFSSSHVWM